MRKGRYPGGPKWGIFDRRVWNGCASEGRVEELRVGGEEGGWGGVRKRFEEREESGVCGGSEKSGWL